MDLFTHGDTQMVFFNMNEDDVETIMKDSEVMFGSDSGVRDGAAQALPHPRGLGTFPRVLGLYARQKHLFSIEEGVRRMTSLPAATFGLRDRGQIREGFFADLVVFDKDRIIDTATYDKPLSSPEGIYYVIVNGSLVFDGHGFTKSLPGMVIRRPKRSNPVSSVSLK
jgi:N-acyl-D-aspartate/D-glutamate deacylase